MASKKAGRPKGKGTPPALPAPTTRPETTPEQLRERLRTDPEFRDRIQRARAAKTAATPEERARLGALIDSLAAVYMPDPPRDAAGNALAETVALERVWFQRWYRGGLARPEREVLRVGGQSTRHGEAWARGVMLVGPGAVLDVARWLVEVEDTADLRGNLLSAIGGAVDRAIRRAILLDVLVAVKWNMAQAARVLQLGHTAQPVLRELKRLDLLPEYEEAKRAGLIHRSGHRDNVDDARAIPGSGGAKPAEPPPAEHAVGPHRALVLRKGGT